MTTIMDTNRYMIAVLSLCMVWLLVRIFLSMFCGKKWRLTLWPLGGVVLAVFLLGFPFWFTPRSISASYLTCIAVIGDMRTRIGLYQYEKGRLPCVWRGTEGRPLVETWISSGMGKWNYACAEFSDDNPPLKPKAYVCTASSDSNLPFADVEKMKHERSTGSSVDIGLHIGQLLGSEWERNYCSTPNDYQYLVMRNDTNGTEYAYFIGCFGDGNGLPFGTGYAVCEIGSLNAARKYVGTWSRYKPFGNVQICFTSRREGDEGLGGRTLGCYVPGKSAFDNMTETNTLINIVNAMREHGWCFYEKEENH